MNRTLTLKLFIHKEDGLSLTVKRQHVKGSGRSKKTVTDEATDGWSPGSIIDAITEEAQEYIAQTIVDQGPTPLEQGSLGDKVIEEVVERVNRGELDTPGHKVTAKVRRSRA